MVFINMKKRFVSPLPQLGLLALQHVYNRESMTADKIGLMQQSMVHWSNKVDITVNESHKLQSIGKLLKQDAEGKLAQRKELFIKHKINWMLFHRMPFYKEMGNDIS